MRHEVQQYISNNQTHVYIPGVIIGWEDHPMLSQTVDRIAVTESCAYRDDLSTSLLTFGKAYAGNILPLEEAYLDIHVYALSNDNPFDGQDTVQEGGEEVMVANLCELPNRAWESLWDTLVYEEDIKAKLLNYLYATLIFSDADVDCKPHVTMRHEYVLMFL